jgi:pilus assembly protein CpaE
MKIAVISSEPRQLGPFKAHFDSGDKRHHVTCSPGASPEDTFATDPDLVIIVEADASEVLLTKIDALTTRYPAVQVVLAADQSSPEFLRHAMRAGVREVVPLSPAKTILDEALASAEKRSSLKTKSRENGKLFAVIGCKGGAGTTFLATNWAHVFAADPARRIAFIDLNRQFGDALFYLSDAVPAMDVADLAREAQRLDASLLSGSMVAVRPNFHLLAAAETPEKAHNIGIEEIASILKHALREYDLVIVDLGNVVDEISALVMDSADRIYPVMQATVPYLRAATRLSKVLKTYSREKVEWIVNRYEEHGDVSLRDLGLALNHACLRTIAGSFRTVCAAIAQGVPLAQLDKRDRVVRDLQSWANSVFPSGAAPRENSWFKRWSLRAQQRAEPTGMKA